MKVNEPEKPFAQRVAEAVVTLKSMPPEEHIRIMLKAKLMTKKEADKALRRLAAKNGAAKH